MFVAVSALAGVSREAAVPSDFLQYSDVSYDKQDGSL